MYLEGKVAVVTGAATHIGQAIPVRFASEGAFQSRTYRVYVGSAGRNVVAGENAWTFPQ
jgi:NAD(P)-dependent dehydrogenase (short-subunit alcohol dehydrogenase family)